MTAPTWHADADGSLTCARCGDAGRWRDCPDHVDGCYAVACDGCGTLDRDCGGPATVGRARYAAHRVRYAVTYRAGLPLLRVAVRLLPLHRAAELADRLAAAERRALDPDRYGAFYRYRRTRYVGPDGWPFTGCAVGVDRSDLVSDAAAVAALELARRARVALARADQAVAVADGRRWWREVGR